MRSGLGILFFLFLGACATKGPAPAEVEATKAEVTKDLVPITSEPTESLKEASPKKRVVAVPKVPAIKKEIKLEAKEIPLVEKIPEVTFPFSVGEVLKFKAKARGFNVGTAFFEVLPHQYQGQDKLWHFRFQVRTEGFINNFYSLSIQQESWVDYATLRPRRFLSTVLENKKQKHELDEFDYDLGKILHRQTKDGVDSRELLDLPSKVEDSLTSFYLLRLDQSPRTSMVVHEGKVVPVVIKDLGKEGDLKKFSIDIDKTPSQFVWIDAKGAIQKVLLQTKNGNVELKRF